MWTRLAVLLSLGLGAAMGLALASASSGVTFIPADRVAAAFSTGAVLASEGAYQVHASRRDRPGQVEVHEHETDIIYVLEGTATFVTGGTVVSGTNTASGEIRGSGLTGGEARRLEKGDVIIVPKGTAHWFKEVPGPILYYVVKVRE